MTQTETTRAVDVVIIDNDPSTCEGCRQTLEKQGYSVLAAGDGQQGLRLVAKTRPRLVLLELRMPGLGDFELLEQLPTIDPRIVPIVVSGHGSVDSAVASMKLGAHDFLAKPVDPTRLLEAVSCSLSRRAPSGTAPQSGPLDRVRDAAEADLLLQSLEVQAQYQALGIQGETLDEKLAALEAEAYHHASRLGQVRAESEFVSGLLADLKLVDNVVRKQHSKKNALIQILLDLQTAKHWLPRHMLTWLARRLDVPLARIYSIVTFYEAFSLLPRGAHTVQVCTGTACHVRKGPALLSRVSTALGVQPGETDSDMQFTLKTVNCLGCCALAPVMKVDESYHGNPSLKALKTLFKKCRESEDENA